MKLKTLALVAAVIAAVTLFGPITTAQTAVPTTTLGAALADPNTSPGANVITVASTSGWTAGGPASGVAITTGGGATFAYIDLEQVRVVQVLSSTQARVQRGIAGFASAHANGSTVYYGPGTAFKAVDPPIGACDPASFVYTPWINVGNGNMSVCQYRTAGASTRSIITTNSRSITYGSQPQACATGVVC